MQVAAVQGLQHSAAEAQAQLATANGKAASAGKALCQAQLELHQLHDAYRRDCRSAPCLPCTHDMMSALYVPCTHNMKLVNILILRAVGLDIPTLNRQEWLHTNAMWLIKKNHKKKEKAVSCCRRREGEVQRWKGLANQARAEGQSLQATRDEEAGLYADQVRMQTQQGQA